MELAFWFKCIFCEKNFQKNFLAKRGPFWVPLTPSTKKFWNFNFSKCSSMSVGSVSIKEKNGKDLHSAQKIHQKWLVGPILSYFGLYWAVSSYIKLWLCPLVSIFIIHENWEWDKWYGTLFLKIFLKNDEFYLFLVIFCGFGLYLAIFRLLCSSKPFFSTLDNQDLQRYHERDEDKALNSML